METIISQVSEAFPRWACIFLAETDAHYNSSFSLTGDWHHLLSRHWPGPGSVPFSLLIRDHWAPFVKSIVYEGRACRVHFQFSAFKSVCAVFFHGAHDLPYSLSDVAYLVQTRPKRTKCLLMGDFNVDLLPTYFCDPYRNFDNRISRHHDERMHLEQLLHACKMQLHDVELVTGELPGFPCSECFSAPITRVPVGAQATICSSLDHVAPTGCNLRAEIHWLVFPSDHAAIIASVHVGKQSCKTFQKGTWMSVRLQLGWTPVRHNNLQIHLS